MFLISLSVCPSHAYRQFPPASTQPFDAFSLAIKMSKTRKFISRVRDALLNHLPGQWEVEGAPSFRLLRQYSWGYGGVSAGMSYKGLPACRVHLIYGVTHNCLTPILAQLDRAKGYEPITTVCQVYQTTINKPIAPERYWATVEDYNNCDYSIIASELLANSTGELMTYFDKFGNISTVRDALVRKDNSFFQTERAEIIVAIDYFLQDSEHLRWFKETVAMDYEIRQIEEAAKVLGFDY